MILIAYAISIKFSCTGTFALHEKKHVHNLYPAKSVEDFNSTGIKHCQYICTNYSHKFQQNRLIFLLGANRPGANRPGGRNAAGAKRLGGELDLGQNDPDSIREWNALPPDL